MKTDANKVMVIHDDPVQSRGIEALLKSQGFEVLACTRAGEALAHASNGHRPALMIIHLHLPGIDGWRFCRLVRSPEYPHLNSTPILIVGDHIMPDQARQISIELGAHAFLLTPLDPGLFHGHVRAAMENKPSHHPCRVLVVEDTRTQAQLMGELFTERGYLVEFAATGQEAVRQFRKAQPDLVLLDYHLPDMMGDQLLQEFKQTDPSVVIVMLTIDSTPELAMRFLNLGADGWVRKPFDPQSLADFCEKTRRERSLLKVQDLLLQRNRELQRAEMRFRSLFDNIPESVLVHDLKGEILLINESGARRLEWSPAELMGRDLKELVAAVHAPRISSHVKKTLQTGLSIFETSFISRSGRPWCAEVTERVIDFDGHPAILSVSRDITERKKAEEDLRQSEERFRSFFNLSAVGCAIIGLDKRWIEVNDRLCEMVGYTREELVGTSWADITPPDDLQAETPSYEQLLKGEIQQGTKEKVYIHKDGRKIHVRISARVMRTTNHEAYIMAVIEDITEQKQSHEYALKCEAQIQHAQKLESLGVLTGGLAHDFNNLLVSILGNVELVLSELSPLAPGRQRLEDIQTTSLRATELIRQMLAYSGKTEFTVEPLDLNSLVRELGQLLHVSISKKVNLRYAFAEGLPLIEADASQIRQVVMNLIINASDAIGDKDGTIHVNTGVIEADRAYLTETYLDDNLPEGHYAYLEVTDTGCGMTRETRARLFDPFYTTKVTGRGLGLSAVLGIIRGHHGAIKVYSEVGKGSTFKVLFPCPAHALTATITRGGAPNTSKWRGSGTVLVVDDEESVRTVTRMMLEKMGFSVLTAADGRECLEVFSVHNKEIQVVVLDMTMPRLDGPETYRELRKLDPSVTVILSSGYNEQDAMSRFAEKGLAGFIQKPFQMRALMETFRAVLEKP